MVKSWCFGAKITYQMQWYIESCIHAAVLLNLLNMLEEINLKDAQQSLASYLVPQLVL